MSEGQAAVGAQIVSVKVLKTQPDVVQITLEVPGEFKAVALQLGNYVGWYFPAIAFINPQRDLMQGPTE